MNTSILTSFNEVTCSLSLGLKPVCVLVSVSWKTLGGLFSSTFMSSLVKMFSPLPALLKTSICIFIALIICPDVFLQRQWRLLRVLKGTVHPTLTFHHFVSELLGKWNVSRTGANLNLMSVFGSRIRSLWMFWVQSCRYLCWFDTNWAAALFEMLLFGFFVFLLTRKHKMFHCCWQWMEFFDALKLKTSFSVRLLKMDFLPIPMRRCLLCSALQKTEGSLLDDHKNSDLLFFKEQSSSTHLLFLWLASQNAANQSFTHHVLHTKKMSPYRQTAEDRSPSQKKPQKIEDG